MADHTADLLDELRARAPLATLVGRRVQLVRAGRHWKACCPFHAEKMPSFYVYDDHYHCFGCGEHGDVFAFIPKTDSLDFDGAVKALAKLAEIRAEKAIAGVGPMTQRPRLIAL